MTPASTATTTLLKQFGPTTEAEKLVPRLTQAGQHDALTVPSPTWRAKLFRALPSAFDPFGRAEPAGRVRRILVSY